MTVFTTCLSSSERRVVASNCSRRSSAGPRSFSSKTSVSALTDSAMESLRSTSRVGEESPAS
jgi:hypothetical protein